MSRAMKKESVCHAKQTVSTVLHTKVVSVAPLDTISSTDTAPTPVLLEPTSPYISTAPLAPRYVLPAAQTLPALLASQAIISSSTPPHNIAPAFKLARLDILQMLTVDGAKNACQLALHVLQPPHALNATPTLRSLMDCASTKPTTTARPIANYVQDRIA